MKRNLIVAEIQTQFKLLKDELKQELLDLQLSLQQETKSSMGDKYETQREMIQQEISRNQEQLAVLDDQLLVSELNPKLDTIQNGNIVELILNKQTILVFIGVSIGNVKYENTSIIKTISLDSPLGKLLIGKKKGDKIILNQNPYLIQDCY